MEGPVEEDSPSPLFYPDSRLAGVHLVASLLPLLPWASAVEGEMDASEKLLPSPTRHLESLSPPSSPSPHVETMTRVKQMLSCDVSES